MKRMMMKVAALVVCVGSMLFFEGCGRKEPDKVALDFLQTLAAGKADKDYFKKNCTEDTAAFFSVFGGMAAQEMKGATFTVVETKIDGDKAKVTLKQNGGKTPNEPEVVDLRKVDGRWKVDVKKEEKEEKN